MKNLYRIARRVSDSLLLPRCSPKWACRYLATDSFKYEDLRINLVVDYQAKEQPSFANLQFGKTFSDHMFQVEWTAINGWGVPMITPIHFFQLHPGAKVLHYAQAAFEGMKVFKASDKTVAFFRPDLNMKRLEESSRRVALPAYDSHELLRCIAKLVNVDKHWVPYKDHSSLYIRPNFIGVEGSLGVSSTSKALLYVVTCPVGPYFESAVTEPLGLLADPNYVRAFPGGAGGYKIAANYAPTLYIQNKAKEAGLNQVLWLLGGNHQICEAGAMNVFFFLKNANGEQELVTPSVDGTILPGVTRQSVLDLARQWDEFKVSERIITMEEVITANNEKRLSEMFLCGTAALVCPVNYIRFMEEDIKIPTMDQKDPLYDRFLKDITDIQYRVTESEWSVPIHKFL